MRGSSIKPSNIIVLLCVLLTLAAAFAAYYYMHYTLAPEQVDISVRYSPNVTCSRDTPVYMLIKNDSGRDIVKTSFSLTVKKGSTADNYIQLLEKTYSTETVIKAGDSYGGCWVFPELITKHYVPEELIYEIGQKIIVFSD